MDDTTAGAAPPAAGAGAAPAPAADPSADQPLSDRELKDLCWSLSPQEASDVLAAWSEQYRSAPAPHQPRTPTEAAQRLAELSADPTFRQNLLNGSSDARREWDALNQLKANATPLDQLTDQLTETVGEGELSRRNRLSIGRDMVGRGLTPELVERLLSSETFTLPGNDGWTARNLLPKMLNDPDFRVDFWPGSSREDQIYYLQVIASAQPE
jgi:hypothetical protein